MTTDAYPAVREAFEQGTPMQRLMGQVLDELGGVDFLVDWAEENPGEYVRILMAANPAPQQIAAAPGQPGGSGIHLHLHPSLAPTQLDDGGHIIEHESD